MTRGSHSMSPPQKDVSDGTGFVTPLWGERRNSSLAKSPAEDPRNQEIPLMGGLGCPEGGVDLQQGRWFQPASALLAQILAFRAPVGGRFQYFETARCLKRKISELMATQNHVDSVDT